MINKQITYGYIQKALFFTFIFYLNFFNALEDYKSKRVLLLKWTSYLDTAPKLPILTEINLQFRLEIERYIVILRNSELSQYKLTFIRF